MAVNCQEGTRDFGFWQDVRLDTINDTPNWNDYAGNYCIKIFILKCFPELIQTIYVEVWTLDPNLLHLSVSRK